MGNVVESLVSGFTKVLADLLAKPLDFLSGKACSTACAPTWDIVCYVENLCVASLAKTAATPTSNKGSSEGSLSRRRVYLERSLRPRNVSRRSHIIKEGKEPRVNHRHDGSESERELHHHHGIKVTHTSRFARKGTGKIRAAADRRKEQE